MNGWYSANQRTDVAVSLSQPQQSGYVRLVNRRSGKVLDVTGNGTADGVKVVQWTWSGGANQQWQLLSNPDGSVRLVNRNSGRLLDSPAGA
ncbi:RICIN domain-containing protein, partial [Kibdelosporangium lantanae]